MNLIQIENRTGKLSLNDHVNPDSINRVIEEMQRLYGNKAVAENCKIGDIVCAASDALEVVEMTIHSPGGSVLDGYRLFHAIGEMRGRGVKVVATINTLAASMGSVIAMAADEIKIVPGGRMMIHEASQAIYGNAEDHARAAKILDEISAEIAGIYATKTGKDVSAIRDLMKKETWMGADEAVAMGFADSVFNPSKGAKNKTVDIADMKAISADMSFLDRLTSPSDTEARERIAALENTITGHDAIVAELEAKLVTAESALQEAAGLKVENAGLTESVTALNAKVEDFTAQVANLTEKATLTTAKIDTAAADKLAAMGHGQPLDLSGEKPTSDAEKTKNRAELKSMKPREVSAFVKSGGTFID